MPKKAAAGKLKSLIKKDDKLLSDYIDGIIHSWSKILTSLAFTLVPLFLILDYIITPSEYFFIFIRYRLISTVLIIALHFVVRNTKPGKVSIIHGYLISIILGYTISMMTVYLGGFDSPYYAGLNLVVIGVNLLLPWGAFNSTLSGLIIISMYLSLNIFNDSYFNSINLINNLFFLFSTIIISISINKVRTNLIRDEFYLRVQLKETRDALWGEMKIAKKIQESLLPENCTLGGFSISGYMLPTEEVGGDYYDLITTKNNENWVTIADVSGHGVESGLITMMTQTCIRSILNSRKGYSPARLLQEVNYIMKQNIDRLKVDRYITFLAVKLCKDKIQFSGKHLDLMIYRKDKKTVEVIETEGTWLGLVDDISAISKTKEVKFSVGDVLMLYTDGISEAMNEDGELFGEERLKIVFLQNVRKKNKMLVDSMINEVVSFQKEQLDDITLLILRKI